MRLLVVGNRLELFRCTACGCVHLDITDEEAKTYARYDVTVDEANEVVGILKASLDELRRDLQ